MAAQFGDGTVVPRSDEGGQAGGVHQAIAERKCVEADAEQLGEER